MPTARFASLALIALALAASPSSQAGVYVKGAGLYHQASDIEVNNATAFQASLKSNIGFAAALGYKFSLLRIEAEVQHLKSETESDAGAPGTLLAGARAITGTAKQTSGFANAYFDLPSFFGLAPYVGAGLGYARMDLNDFGRTRNGVPLAQFSGRDSAFGYQGMVGLQFHLFGTATINGGFRYIKRQDIAIRDVVADARQNISLGSSRVFELGFALGF